MSETTPLDAAHAAMEAAPEEETPRLRFYERLADAELFLLLQSEAKGEQITPELFDLADATFVLAFDRESRLTAFTGRAVPYAAMSGRAICAALAPSGLGLALNLEVAPSAFLLPPSGVSWMAETLATRPVELEQQIAEVFAPKGLPEALLTQLDVKLASAAGLADAAYLVGVSYVTGGRGHLLGFVDAVPGAEPALARAVAEVLHFSGLEAATLDVGFFGASEQIAAVLAKEGLRFDLPRADKRDAGATPAAPGMDPSKPPILK